MKEENSWIEGGSGAIDEGYLENGEELQVKGLEQELINNKSDE